MVSDVFARRRSASVVVAGVLAVAALAACTEDAPPPPDDDELAAGQEIFQTRCATCHGFSGDGGSAPALVDVEERFPDIESQMQLVAEGVDGTNMRGFADRLDDDELEAVVRYTRESL